MEDNQSGILVKSKSSLFGLSRRAFLGVSATVVAALAVGRLFKKPAFSFDNSSGEPANLDERWMSTSCLNCPTRCATRVRVVDGRAVKITGNPLSRVTEGETCARAHIGLQILYNPDRLTTPLMRTNPQRGRGIDPAWAPVSWDEALSQISNRLKSLRDRNEPHRLLLMSGLTSVSTRDLLNRLAGAYGTPNVIAEESIESQAGRSGEMMAVGHDMSGYDLENCSYVLSFGANILESATPLSRNLRMWGKIRRERPNRAKVVVVDPRYSVTAARADRWLPINPGTDAALAMGIAGVIISENLYDAEFVDRWTTGFDEYGALALSEYPPESVAEITGVPADTIREIAREFATTRPAVAWPGRGATAWPGGSYAGYAIFCLNALVGSIDVPGGVVKQENPPYRDLPAIVEDETARRGNLQPRIGLSAAAVLSDGISASRVAESILSGHPYPVEMAIGFESNFNLTAPGTARWDEAMSRGFYYVHVGPALSEMAQYADIVLPSATFLEDWAYDHSPPGSGFAETRIKQPVVPPPAGIKSVPDIIFELAGRLGVAVAQSFRGIGDNAEEFVRYRTTTLAPWQELLEKGVWTGPDYEFKRYDRMFHTPSGKFEFRSGVLEARLAEAEAPIDRLALLPRYEPVEFLGNEADFPLRLSTYRPLLDVANGQNYPWAQELYLPLHGAGWTSFAEMNTQTARSLGINDGDEVRVESPFGRLKTRARVFEGILPGVVAIAAGQGHYAGGRWADGIGVNPNDIIGTDYDRLSGRSAYFNTRVRVYRA